MGDEMLALSIIGGAIICVIFYIYVKIPIFIARKRGVSDSTIITIKVLSILGVLVFPTWLIAFLMSLFCRHEEKK